MASLLQVATLQKLRKELLSFVTVFFLLFYVGDLAFALEPQHQSSSTPSVNQLQKPILIVGSEQHYPPFSTGMTDAEAGGFTVELWKAVAAEVGLNYTIHVKPFHQILDEFKSGKIDVLINLAQSDSRNQFTDFSVPHVVVNGAIFVRKGESSILSEDDLSQKSVIVLDADILHDYAISKGWSEHLIDVNTAEEGLRLLASGQHDAFLVSKLVGMQTLKALGITNIEPLKLKVGMPQKFSFAVREGNSELLGKINEGLSIVKANGTYDALYVKWFGLYEDKEVGLRDIIKYIAPLIIALLGVSAYFYYRRRLDNKQAYKQLQENEQKLSTILENVEAYIYLKNTKGQYLFANRPVRELFNATMDEIVGHGDEKFFDEKTTAKLRANDSLVLVEGQTIRREETNLTIKDGKSSTYFSVKLPLRDETGSIYALCGISTDITERIQHENAIKAAQLREQSRSNIMEMLSRDLPLKDILEAIVKSVEVFNPSMLCSILLLDREGKHLINGVAPSLPNFFNEAINGVAIGLGVGSCGTAAYINARVVVEDIATHPYWASYKELAASAGLGSCWSQPIHSASGNVLGTFAIYHHQANTPSTADITLIEQSANLASIAIERKYAADELKIVATAFEAQEGMLITDANNVILRVNHAFTKITGFSSEDAIGQTTRLLKSDKQDEAFYKSMWDRLNDQGYWEGEIWNRRKNGEVYPANLTITAVKDASNFVTNYVATLNDITISKAASDEIKTLAFYDPLTQLPNRRLLVDRLNQAMVSSARSGHQGALLFIDLDHFKILNDTLGHDMGDLLLQQVASRLIGSVRKGDTVARLGGDEFVVLLEDLSEKNIEAASQTQDIAEKIMLSLKQPYKIGAQNHYSTLSIGATLFEGDTLSLDELLKQADIAMYQSKSKGRNTLCFFDPKMQEAIANRADMEHELRMAVDNKQFQLYYQVQVGTSGQALGAEVLIRWIHPERGIISPLNFIPLAEETGLILPIGQWVIDTACAQLKTWQQNPLTRDLVIAVNVSAKQFFQSDFVEQLLETIARHDIAPSHLKLELTESMLVDNINEIISKMNALSQIGVRFSLDDFGTGYSSLQYLKKLPLNQLKIDQSFVRDIVADASDRAIVRTIVTMAHSLDINVIAEGVETEEQRQYLLDNGCTHYQGYLFSKPVPIDEFEALLSKS